MFRNVVCALNEALDITMHLKPLTEIFEVIFDISLPLFSVRNLWGDGSTKKTNNLVFFRRWPQQTFPMFDRCSLRWCTRQVFTANELYRQFCFQICLVYCNSEHYNTTARVIILLQVSFHFEEKRISLCSMRRRSAIIWLTWQGSSWTRRRSSRLRLQLESRILLLLATGWGGSGQSHGVHPEPQGVQDLLPGVFQNKQNPFYQSCLRCFFHWTFENRSTR